ncbi:MAG: hypothetical protein NTZ47_08265 [Bacteroidetes bacterium]|jgi:hypothetical protein|nr:hypothetical protein [Bacteroidota bacterium]
MKNQYVQKSSALKNGSELVKQRDEQIRRVLSAAQYQKYKDIEKVLQPHIQPASLVSSSHNPEQEK